MLKIKFIKDFPTDETILNWEKDFGCLHIPDLVIYKDEKNKTLLIDIDMLDQTLPPLSIFFKEFMDMDDIWISGECDHDFQTRYYFETNRDDFKIDIRKTYSDWNLSGKNILLWKYELLKSIGASIDYIRFSLSRRNDKYIKFIDRVWNPTDEEMEIYDSFDDKMELKNEAKEG